jgi:hypothetical protein
VKIKDEEEDFDYIDMGDINVENPSNRKKFPLKIESDQLEEITEQYEPLTGMASEVAQKFNFDECSGGRKPSNDISDVVSNTSHASSVK